MTSIESGRSKIGLFAGALAAALALATPALAQNAADKESARQLYADAQTALEKGDTKTARDKLTIAFRLARTPILGLELGKAHAALGELVEAREACLAVSRIPVSPEETARSEAARREAEELAEKLAPRIATVTLRLTPDDPAATVLLDGTPVPPDVRAAPRKVNPGAHRLVVRQKGGDTERSFALKEGETQTLTVAIKPPAPGAPPAPGVPPAPGEPIAPGPQGKKTSPLVFVGFGLGAAGAAVGAITGVLALKTGSDIEQRCNGLSCPPGTSSDLDSGRTMATISTVAFVVGGVGAALGVVGLLTSGPSEKRGAALWLGPGSAGVRGRF